MALKPDTDPISGQLRLIGDNTAENIQFFPGQLGIFPLGALLLGGNDTVQGSSDSERVQGNQDDDSLFGGGGNDTLYGGQGNDQTLGELGNDLIFGEGGKDSLIGVLSEDQTELLGLEGDDTFFGGGGDDVIREGLGNDVVFGGQDNDELRGGRDNDLIFGNDGDDFVAGEEGLDTLAGGEGKDQLRGDAGEDILRGEGGDDVLTSGDGNDLAFGGQGSDRITGETGNDTLYGDQGSDTLSGNAGSDVFVLVADTETDTILDFQHGEDQIVLLGNLSFESLNFIEDSQQKNTTRIEDERGRTVAILPGVSPNLIERSDFFIPGVISFSSANFSLQENGTPLQPITVTRTAGTDGTVSATVVPVRTPSTPPPNEINLNPIVVTFASGDNSPKTITFPVTNDQIPDYTKSFELRLENPTNLALLVEPNQAFVEIFDDEPRLSELGTILNPIPQTNSNFGQTLASLDNNLLIVGAPNQQNGLGNAYLFNPATAQTLLTFQNPAAGVNPEFGKSVATFGENIFISAPGESTLAVNTGAVYRFSLATGTSFLRIDNPTPDPFDQFGYSVSTLANYVLIGAPTDNTSAPRSGIAYLFDGNSGQLLQTFTNPDPQMDDNFGASVALVGDKVLIGAPSSLTVGGATRPGIAYIFDSVTGELLQTFKNPVAGLDEFGYTVAWTGIGRDILIGAPGDDTGSENAGIAFLLDGITAAVLETYRQPNPESFDQFGQALTMFGSDIIVGAPGYNVLNSGAAFRYELRTGNLVQTYVSPVSDAGDGNLNFGASVARVGNNVIVGVPGYDGQSQNEGLVYQF